jgi:putative phage-type endonuclease
MKESIPILDKPRFQTAIENALNGDRKILLTHYSFNDWLTFRAMIGIGASEVAAVLGLNKYETPFSVWQKKVSDEILLEENDFMTFGNLVEPALIAWYNKKTGNSAIKDSYLRIHKDFNCLFADLDGIMIDDSGNECGLVECKSTSQRTYDSWQKDEEDCVQGVPLYHYCQIQHELSVTGLPWCDLAVLITDRRQLKILRINRDDEYITKQNEVLVAWYNAYVVPMIPPELTAQELSHIEPAEGTFTEASQEIADSVRLLKDLADEMKLVEHRYNDVKDLIIRNIGDKENLTYSGSVLATFKMQSRVTLMTDLIKQREPDIFDRFGKTTTFRVLRIKK